MPSPGQTMEARRAHQALHAALSARAVVRPETCSQCGNPPNSSYEPVQAHHDDYTKPLEVRWLCRSCHIRHHVSLRKAAQQEAA